jgi:hypothetical protein
VEALRARGAMAASLLEGLAPGVDLAEAWARLAVRTGGGVASRPRMRAWPAALAGAAVVALLTLRLVPAPGPDDGELLAMVRAARDNPNGEVLRDRCCQDHDGGERADDGLLTISRPGERVAVVVVYEDVDRSGTFTPGDIIRHVSREARR